jgi:LacI family transcriptional regulator
MTTTAAAKSKHRMVYQALREEITSGRYAAGDRLPSEAELVARFGASRPTIARALRELQHERLLERRAGSGSYVAHAAEPAGGVFGLIIPRLGQTEIFGPIGAAMAQAARGTGYGLLWGDSAPGKDESGERKAEDLCREYVERKVAGVFFAPLELAANRESVNHRVVAALRQARIPVVLLDRDIEPFPGRSDLDLVGIDNFAAGYGVAEHLAGAGCRRVAFLARPGSAATVDARIAGCREALARRDLEHAPRSTWVRFGQPADPAFVGELLASARPDAIVCANDETAALLMQTLAGLGRRVPQDVRVVGFDDVRYATLLSVPLTTVHQPVGEIGATAVHAMLQRLREPTLPPRHLVLHAPLVVRASSGPDARTDPTP